MKQSKAKKSKVKWNELNEVKWNELDGMESSEVKWSDSEVPAFERFVMPPHRKHALCQVLPMAIISSILKTDNLHAQHFGEGMAPKLHKIRKSE